MVFALSELQIRGIFEDESEISLLFLKENIHCDHSLEPFFRDRVNDRSDTNSPHKFLWRNMENYP